MNNFFYILVARDELVNVIKTGEITLSSYSRVVSPSQVSIDLIKSQLKDKLDTLNLNTSEDYVLSLVELNNISLGAELTLSIFSLKKLYCFDETSLSAYSRNFSQFRFSLIEFDFHVEDIIDNTNKKRLFKILQDEFKIAVDASVIELSKQVENHLATSEKVKTLFNYKRETSLIDGNKSLLNDTVTLAMLNSDKDSAKLDALYQNYIAGKNIAEKPLDSYLGKSEALDDIDSMIFIAFIQAVIKIINGEKQSPNNFITRLNASDLNAKFDYLIFKLIYLKLKNVFRESENFNDLLDLHSGLTGLAEVELNVAYILFFGKLEYSDLYTSYYAYKELDLFNDYVLPKSDYDKTIESLNSKLIIKDEELKNLKKENIDLEKRLNTLQDDCDKTKEQLKQKSDKFIQNESNFLNSPPQATYNITEPQVLQYLFFEIFSEKDIKPLKLSFAKKLCATFGLQTRNLKLDEMISKLIEHKNNTPTDLDTENRLI